MNLNRLKKGLILCFVLTFILSSFNQPRNLDVNAFIAPQNQSVSTDFADQFNQSATFQYIETQLNFGYRIPGSEGNRACVQWMRNEMAMYGNTQIINFTVEGITCQNVLTKVNQGHKDIIIFAAHFDSRNIAEKDPVEENRNTPIMGANDGASGIGVLIEMAKILHASDIDWDYEFWFIFFDAEDQGSHGISGWDWCEGSKWLATDLYNNGDNYFSPSQSIATIEAFVLLDMVGGENLKFILEGYSNEDLRSTVFEIGRSLGYTDQFPNTGISSYVTDDHVAFALPPLEIPTLDMIIKFWDTSAGWPYHHTTQDTIDHISITSLYITGRTLLQFLYEVYHPDASTFPPTYEITDIRSFWEKYPETIYVIIGIALLISSVVIYSKIQKRKIKFQYFDKDVNSSTNT